MRKRFTVMGDSWGTGYVEGGPDHGGWLDVAGIEPALRLAVNGSTAQNWASDFGSHLTGALACADAKSADAVIASLTGNDILQALGDGKITDCEGHSIFHAYKSVLFELANVYGVGNVWVLLYADPWQGRRPDAAIGLAMLKGALMAIAPEGVHFLDAGLVLKPEHFNGTGIHPNAAGHEALGKFIKEAIAS